MLERVLCAKSDSLRCNEKMPVLTGIFYVRSVVRNFHLTEIKIKRLVANEIHYQLLQ